MTNTPEAIGISIMGFIVMAMIILLLILFMIGMYAFVRWLL